MSESYSFSRQLIHPWRFFWISGKWTSPVGTGTLWGPQPGSVLLNVSRAYNSCGDHLKTQALTSAGWRRAWDFVFLTSSQTIPMLTLPVQGLHLEQQGPSTQTPPCLLNFRDRVSPGRQLPCMLLFISASPIRIGLSLSLILFQTAYLSFATINTSRENTYSMQKMMMPSSQKYSRWT